MAERMDDQQGGPRRPRFARRLAVVPLVMAVAVVGCGDDGDPDDADSDDVVDRAEQVAEDVGAYAVAQSLRASLAGQDLDDDADRRNVDVLEDAVDDLPGDPEVSGIEDTTGDGRDDDGRVAVRVGDEEACLTVGEDGDLDVGDSAC
ncbi:MAG TPA: hypothetical protein VFZ79_03840 [Acidimicrobiales bacterium]